MGEADDDEGTSANDKAAGKKAKGGAKGNERKTTGSYYTPDSLVQLLLKEALDPVIDRKVAEKPGEPEALLSLKVIDPACGSGHFILAAARKIARRLAELRHAASPTIAQYRHALRDVAMHCIHGVDRNPMAIELCKVAIWIETVEPGKPLTFMDQKVRCGDSLVGVYDFACLAQGIPDDAYAALSGDDKAAAAHYRKLNARQRGDKDDIQRRMAFIDPPKNLFDKAREIEGMPEDDLDQIAEKRAEFEAWQGTGWINQKRACDLWTAAFFIPKKDVPPSQGLYEVPLTDNVWTAWSGTLPPANLTRAVDKAAEDGAFLHWPLVFADVMEDGGFDCVVGNPPWERVKLQEQEFFASRDEAIAYATNQAARGRLIAALKSTLPGSRERALYEEFEKAKRLAESASCFARMSDKETGRFPLTGRGDVNTYALFAELLCHLTGPKGRAGVIVPTGIATDVTTAPFFAWLVKDKRLFSLHDFQTGMGFFDRIGHARFKFCLLTMGTSGSGPNQPGFSFFSRTIGELEDCRRHFEMSSEYIDKINPNTKTSPIPRSRTDTELTIKIYSRIPVFIEDAQGTAGNSWNAEFNTRIWHMAEDSSWFKTADELIAAGFNYVSGVWVDQNAQATAQRYVPLYEAKLVHQFDHRWATYDQGESRDVTSAEKADPNFEPTSRYWVPEREVQLRLSRLPKDVLDALRSQDEKRIALFVAFLLFGAWLGDAGYLAKPRRLWSVFGEWKAFVAHHCGLRNVVPTSIGVVGDSPALIGPSSVNCLPSAPVDHLVSAASEETAWYEVDTNSLDTMMRTVANYRWRPQVPGKLANKSDVLAYAYAILDASCPKWLTGWRDITNATNERTVIFGCMPRAAVGHTCPLMFVDAMPKLTAALIGNLDSLILDFVARIKVGGTHLTSSYVKQFPILPATSYTNTDLEFIVLRVLELTYTSHSLVSFARDLEFYGPPFTWDDNRRALLRAELDAFYARKYGLTRDDLRYILDPADVMGPDYPSETFRILKSNEIARYGEYRTRRLVLEAWDCQSGQRNAA